MLLIDIVEMRTIYSGDIIQRENSAKLREKKVTVRAHSLA
jgi:hypothetical protein